MSEHQHGSSLTPAPTEIDEVEFSNAIRLNGREWLVVGLLVLPIIIFSSKLWKQQESFHREADYRMPHDLSSDYWLYERWSDLAAEQFDTLLIGDSVVWGEYTTRQETLSHFLNAGAGRERFANLGLDGAHPLALNGLIENYAAGVLGKSVVLHCNLMWLREPKTDLQEEGADVNHPRLVPQFAPAMRAYKEEISPRLGILVEQRLPFSKWTSHLQQAYFRTDVPNDIPTWTLAHPYANPLQPLRKDLPPSANLQRHLPQPWYKNDIAKQDFPWVDLERSLQWRAFQRTVKLLQDRGNRVFVLVGPFNEHLLNPESRRRYEGIKDGITAWLEAEHIPHLAPPALPSDDYGDASHPLASGYARLAGLLLNEAYFKNGQN